MPPYSIFKLKNGKIVLSFNDKINDDATFTSASNFATSTQKDDYYDSGIRNSNQYLYTDPNEAMLQFYNDASNQKRNLNPYVTSQNEETRRRKKLFVAFNDGISNIFNQQGADGNPLYTPSNIKSTYPELHDIKKFGDEIGTGYYTDDNGKHYVPSDSVDHIVLRFDSHTKGAFGLNWMSKDNDNAYEAFLNNYLSQYGRSEEDLSTMFTIDKESEPGVVKISIPRVLQDSDGNSDDGDEYYRALSCVPTDSKNALSYLSKSPISVKGYYRDENGIDHELTKKETDGWAIAQAASMYNPGTIFGPVGLAMSQIVPSAIKRWISTNDNAIEYDRGTAGWERDQASALSFTEDNFDLRRMMAFRDFYKQLNKTYDDEQELFVRTGKRLKGLDKESINSYIQTFQGSVYSPETFYINDGESDVIREVSNKDFNKKWKQKIGDLFRKQGNTNRYTFGAMKIYSDGRITGPEMTMYGPKGERYFLVMNGALDPKHQPEEFRTPFYVSVVESNLKNGTGCYISSNGNKYCKNPSTGKYVCIHPDGNVEDLNDEFAANIGNAIAEDFITRKLSAMYIPKGFDIYGRFNFTQDDVTDLDTNIITEVSQYYGLDEKEFAKFAEARAFAIKHRYINQLGQTREESEEEQPEFNTIQGLTDKVKRALKTYGVITGAMAKKMNNIRNAKNNVPQDVQSVFGYGNMVN